MMSETLVSTYIKPISTISSGWIMPTAIMPTVARLMEMRSTVPSSRRWA